MSRFRHAPRGPIKARPIKTGTYQRCSAHSARTGAPCKKAPIRGGTVCRTHGGAAPQVKAAAEKRLEDLRPAAISYLDWLLCQKEFPSAGLGAARDVLDRNDGRPTEHIDMRVTEVGARLDAARQVARERNAQKPQ